MEGTEEHVCRICGLDLRNDLEMIAHISEQHQVVLETNPDPHAGDAPHTGTKLIKLFNELLSNLTPDKFDF